MMGALPFSINLRFFIQTIIGLRSFGMDHPENEHSSHWGWWIGFFSSAVSLMSQKKKGLVLKLQVFVKFRILVLLCESWADFDPIWIKVFPILEFWHTLFCAILICWTHNFLTNYDPIWITVFLILEFWETLFYGILPIKKNSLWCLFDLPFPGLLRFIIIIEWDGSSSYWIYIRILKWSNFLNFSLSCWKNQ